MKTICDPQQMQRAALAWRAEGKTIGFVPTMGFLHAGHTSLMDVARLQCDVLVVSIFVNPLQFGPSEDLARYPRDPEGDADKCRAHGVDILFMPPKLYPTGHASRVRVHGLTEGLCGANRPSHFEGVTTVVARLFGLVQPSVAVFGEKDYQQLAIIRRMTRDLALPVQVIGAPLVRDHDGVALSSRNKYLSVSQRQRARSLSAALRGVVRDVAAGGTHVPSLLEAAHRHLDSDFVDYLDIRDADDLSAMQVIDRPARVFGAARYGPTRLIDNMALPEPKTS